MATIALLNDIAFLIIAATVFAALAKLLRQPLILGYVVAGLVIGPNMLGLIKNQSTIVTLSELGITFLLFMIGLEFDVSKLRRTGISAIILGALQVLLTFAASFLVSLIIGLKPIESFYVGLIIAFSSTLIVVKLFSDKGELDSMHGRLVLGVLIIQDVFAVFALSLLNSLGHPSVSAILGILGKGAALILIVFLISAVLLKIILKLVSSSQELLFIGALSICFLFAYFADRLGYSVAIGAFFAGVALASSRHNLEIVGRIKSLRDFFLVLFFASLGMQIVLGDVLSHILLTIAFFLLAVAVKPIIVFFIMKKMRFGNRTAFMSGLSLGQISEFSLIVASQGLLLGHISQGIFSVTTLITIISIVLSSYLIKYDSFLYERFRKFLKRYEFADTKEEKLENLPERSLEGHIIIFGIYRSGLKVIDTMMKLQKPFVVVDFNPEKIADLIRKRVSCVCGDMTNLEILEKLRIEKAKMIISTIYTYESNAFLIRRAKRIGSKALLIVSAKSLEEAVSLYRMGATYVVVPDSLAGEKISNYMIHLTEEGIKEWGRKHYLSLLNEIRHMNSLSLTFSK